MNAIIERNKNQAYEVKAENLTALVYIAGTYDNHLEQTGFQYIVQFKNQAGCLQTKIEGDSMDYLTIAGERLEKDFFNLVNEAIDHFCSMPYLGTNIESIKDLFYTN